MLVMKITLVYIAKARRVVSFIKCLLNKINAFKVIKLRSMGAVIQSSVTYL